MAKATNIFDFNSKWNAQFLIGAYRSEKKQLKWILKHRYYNVRAGSTLFEQREGAQTMYYSPSYILLYDCRDFNTGIRLFKYSGERFHKTENEMIQMGYPDPKGDYFLYGIGDEITSLPNFFVAGLQRYIHKMYPEIVKFAPICWNGAELEFANKIKTFNVSGKKYQFIDLFAGAGGLSEGFVRAGFKPIAHIEMNNYACDTLRTRAAFHYLDEHNQLDIYEEYLRTKKEKENGEALWKQVPQRVIDSVIEATIGANTIDSIFKRVDELTNGEHVDLIIGGPPCQAYSIAGRARMGDKVLDDPRNELYKYYVEFLKRYTPEMFVFENVPGIQTAKKGEPFKDLRRVVDEAGYEMDFRVQLASDHGVLQNRRRMIIVGWKKGSNIRYPELQPELSNYTIRRDILADLPERKAGEGHLCAPIEYTKPANEMPYLVEKGLRGKMPFTTQHIARPNNLNDREIYKMAVEWWKRGKRLKYTDIPADHQKHKNKQTFLNRFQVVDPNGCCHTLVAHIAMDGHYYIYPTENPTVDNVRSITIREAARIQSFPDDYFFEGSRSAAFKQIGNAVPVLLAEKIANEVNILLSEYHEH